MSDNNFSELKEGRKLIYKNGEFAYFQKYAPSGPSNFANEKFVWCILVNDKNEAYRPIVDNKENFSITDESY